MKNSKFEIVLSTSGRKADIKDIDGDGIFELSYSEIDESEKEFKSFATADYIITWLKWDGKDGFKEVKKEYLKNNN